MFETAKCFSLLQNGPATTWPSALLVCVVGEVLKGREIPRKGKGIYLEGKRKVLFLSPGGWSSTGEVGECPGPLGAAFTAGWP